MDATNFIYLSSLHWETHQFYIMVYHKDKTYRAHSASSEIKYNLSELLRLQLLSNVVCCLFQFHWYFNAMPPMINVGVNITDQWVSTVLWSLDRTIFIVQAVGNSLFSSCANQYIDWCFATLNYCQSVRPRTRCMLLYMVFTNFFGWDNSLALFKPLYTIHSHPK